MNASAIHHPLARGIGGWLALLIGSLAILSPFQAARSLNALVTHEELERFAPANWAFVMVFAVVVLALTVAGSLRLAWLLYARRHREVVRTVIRGLWALCLLPGVVMMIVIAIAIATATASDMLFQYAGGIVDDCITGLGFGWTLVWTIYLRRSRRVRATYTA